MDNKYSAGRSDGGCCVYIVRSAFVKVSSFAMRERVPDNVARAWARNAYGTGASGFHPAAAEVGL